MRATLAREGLSVDPPSTWLSEHYTGLVKTTLQIAMLLSVIYIGLSEHLIMISGLSQYSTAARVSTWDCFNKESMMPEQMAARDCRSTIWIPPGLLTNGADPEAGVRAAARSPA
jgi:hypothetical protein